MHSYVDIKPLSLDIIALRKTVEEEMVFIKGFVFFSKYIFFDKKIISILGTDAKVAA